MVAHTYTISRPSAFFIMGRPGAGKDTQAEFLAQELNLHQIKTAYLLQESFKKNSDDPQIVREKKIFETGELNTPQWVLRVVEEYVAQLNAQEFKGKKGIIFSGSPRTKFESDGLVPFLEKIFGTKNLFAIYLDITEEEGIRRILKRNARELDRDPEKLNVRMQEYDVRTKPVLDFFTEHGMLRIVDGMKTPQEVFEEVLEALNTAI